MDRISNFIAGFLKSSEDHFCPPLSNPLCHFVDFRIQFRSKQIGNFRKEELNRNTNFFGTTLGSGRVDPLVAHFTALMLGETLHLRHDRIHAVDTTANFCEHKLVHFRFDYWKIWNHFKMLTPFASAGWDWSIQSLRIETWGTRLKGRKPKARTTPGPSTSLRKKRAAPLRNTGFW